MLSLILFVNKFRGKQQVLVTETAFQAKVTTVMLLFSCQVVSKSFATPWTVARQAPLSMQFLRQEYWSGLLFASPGDLPDPGTEPLSPALAGGFCQEDTPMV